jgi:aspartate oxidase
MQHAMTEHVGIVRTNRGLEQASSTVGTLVKQYEKLPAAPFSIYPVETHNLLITAKIVIESALRRTTNVGLHYNSDLAPITV